MTSIDNLCNEIFRSRQALREKFPEYNEHFFSCGNFFDLTIKNEHFNKYLIRKDFEKDITDSSSQIYLFIYHYVDNISINGKYVIFNTDYNPSIKSKLELNPSFNDEFCELLDDNELDGIIYFVQKLIRKPDINFDLNSLPSKILDRLVLL